MTDEMLAVAEENKRKSGLENVKFLKGDIENIPLPDNSVDVIISNCVINLSGDKDRVLQRGVPGAQAGRAICGVRRGRRGEVPAEIRKSMELWVGCMAGALADYEYIAKLAKPVSRRSKSRRPANTASRTHGHSSRRGAGRGGSCQKIDGTFASAFVRATKPAVGMLRPLLLQIGNGHSSQDRGRRCGDRRTGRDRDRVGHHG